MMPIITPPVPKGFIEVNQQFGNGTEEPTLIATHAIAYVRPSPAGGAYIMLLVQSQKLPDFIQSAEDFDTIKQRIADSLDA